MERLIKSQHCTKNNNNLLFYTILADMDKIIDKRVSNELVNNTAKLFQLKRIPIIVALKINVITLTSRINTA